MVERLIRRQIERRVRPEDRECHVEIMFPEGMFDDAPTWSPGPDFVTCIENRSWIRDNGDGTWTLVTGSLTDDDNREVVLTAIITDPYQADNKPHKYLYRSYDDVVVSRTLEPYGTHPLKRVQDYWKEKEEEMKVFSCRFPGVVDPSVVANFTGESRLVPFSHGGYGTVVEIDLSDAGEFHEGVRAVERICRKYGARFRVHSPRDEPWELVFPDWRAHIYYGRQWGKKEWW